MKTGIVLSRADNRIILKISDRKKSSTVNFFVEIKMENSEAEKEENSKQQEEIKAGGDDELYSDLDDMAGSSALQNSMIERFNNRFTPKQHNNNLSEFEPDEEEPLNDYGLEDADLYGDLNAVDKQLAAEEVKKKKVYLCLHVTNIFVFLINSWKLKLRLWNSNAQLLASKMMNLS